jgi:uncharacterized protein (TIGR02646 family)
MRHINLEGQTPPIEWLDRAAALSQEVQAKHDAGDIEGRNRLIEDNADIWKELVPWLAERSHEKCWYSEATNCASYLHVDHFRPKKAVKDLDGNTSDGYWWLAFKWQNYRLSGSAVNIPKSTKFPLREDTIRAAGPHDDENDEFSYLLDPLNAADPALLSFNEKGKAIPGDPSRDWNRRRAEVTIDVLNLNYDGLTRGRQVYWEECDRWVNKALNLMNALQERASATKKAELETTIKDLCRKVSKDAQFSAVATTCVRSQGVNWLAEAVFRGQSA